MEFKVQRMNENAYIPTKATNGSIGYDLYTPHDFIINSDEILLIPLDIRIELLYGYEAQIRPRSGLAIKYGITVLNSPGTIDIDYLGNVGVILINHGKKSLTFDKGDRIAQMVIAKVPDVVLIESNIDIEGDRGESGFGSTGK